MSAVLLNPVKPIRMLGAMTCVANDHKCRGRFDCHDGLFICECECHKVLPLFEEKRV